jgi:iron complex transport system substrate-binding protein
MHRDELLAVGAGKIIAVDAAAYFSRPGPRIVDGLELLAWLIHPSLADEPGTSNQPGPADGPVPPPRALTVEL